MKTHLIPTIALSFVYFSVAPLCVQGQFIYTTNNGTITITQYLGPGGAVSIPSQIDGLPVASIGNEAFYQASLTSVTIPDSVTYIGDSAFIRCSGLTRVTIGNNVGDIAGSAFYYCMSLTNVTMGNSVTNIGNYAFDGCGLPDVTLPNGLNNLGMGVFADCENLTNVTIPNSITNIGDSAFVNCSGLTNVVIGSSVTKIGDSAFSGCIGLTEVTIPGGVVNIESSAFDFCVKLSKIYFSGSAPATGVFPFGGSSFSDPLDAAIAYYIPRTTGWNDFYAGLPTAPWLPQVSRSDGNFGVKSNQFSFDISWASGQTVVVEAATNLLNPVWIPIATNILTSSTSRFSDNTWTNYPRRFYRLALP